MTARASVVICTHNRADLLGGAIRSVLDQDVDPGVFDILVVDNASTDATHGVAASFGDRIRYVHETWLGLAAARNTGWEMAAGEIVVFLDDDAVAGPGWLRAILDVFAEVQPRPGCAGGPVHPIWGAPRPAWLADELLTSLTILDWSDRAHAITDLRQEWLAGANLAVRRDILAALGGFAFGLDRSGARLLSSGDVYLQKQIVNAGLDVWYDPRIAVQHHVPVARLGMAWFKERYFAQGLSDAIMQMRDEDLRGKPVQRARAAIREAARFLSTPRDLAALVRVGDGPAAFRRHCFARIRLGHVAGLLGAV
ncbi:MAG: glycosyltransferase family 2 protein [Longimicrobiales bacterium]